MYLIEKYHTNVPLNSSDDYYVKNTKRRIYDAINVMIASKIIEKRGEGKLKLVPRKKQGNSRFKHEMIDENEEKNGNDSLGNYYSLRQQYEKKKSRV